MTDNSQVLVFASQKGGSGKTTLSGHIAVHAQLAGAGPVALIDTDPQGSLAKWWNARASEVPVFAQTTVQNLQKDIALLKQSGVKLIVIDTPPAVTHAITEVISHADLVVVPTRPSPHDLRAVGVTVDLVEQQQKPLVFVINCATARAKITSETAVSLSQHGTVAPITLHNRVDFAASMIDGRTVGEVNSNCRSAKEVTTLWNYLEDRLRRLQHGVEVNSSYAGQHFEVELLSPIRSQNTSPAPSPVSSAKTNVVTPPPTEVEEDLLLKEVVDLTLETASTAPIQHKEVEKESPLWETFDRRQADSGPPPGMIDRRRAPSFGRRTFR